MKRSCSSWARSIKKLDIDCAVKAEGGGEDSRAMILPESEERSVIDEAGDKSSFEDSIARARSAWRRAFSSLSPSTGRAVVVTGDVQNLVMTLR